MGRGCAARSTSSLQHCSTRPTERWSAWLRFARRKVMQVANDYEKEVSTGDVGRETIDAMQRLTVVTPGKPGAFERPRRYLTVGELVQPGACRCTITRDRQRIPAW